VIAGLGPSVAELESLCDQGVAAGRKAARYEAQALFEDGIMAGWDECERIVLRYLAVNKIDSSMLVSVLRDCQPAGYRAARDRAAKAWHREWPKVPA